MLLYYKDWKKEKNGRCYAYEGWFLFGFIPIYICRYDQDIDENREEVNHGT